MRISYGQSSILRCTIQLAYDRFFTKFSQSNEIQQAVARTDMINRRNEIRAIMDDSGFNYEEARTIQSGGFLETVIE